MKSILAEERILLSKTEHFHFFKSLFIQAVVDATLTPLPSP